MLNIAITSNSVSSNSLITRYFPRDFLFYFSSIFPPQKNRYLFYYVYICTYVRIYKYTFLLFLIIKIYLLHFCLFEKKFANIYIFSFLYIIIYISAFHCLIFGSFICMWLFFTYVYISCICRIVF